jgi:hypothetical protein
MGAIVEFERSEHPETANVNAMNAAAETAL